MGTHRWNLNCSIEDLVLRDVQRKYLFTDIEWLTKVSSWEFQLFKRKVLENFEYHQAFSEPLDFDNWVQDEMEKIERNYQIGKKRYLEVREKNRVLDVQIHQTLDELKRALES